MLGCVHRSLTVNSDLGLLQSTTNVHISQPYPTRPLGFAVTSICRHGHGSLRDLLRWRRNFLPKIHGAPATGKLVLFSRMEFPPGTLGGRYFGQGEWSDVYVYRDGCVPDGKCDSIAVGKVWIDASDTGDAPPKRISGKYEIDLNGKHLEGPFVSIFHRNKH